MDAEEARRELERFDASLSVEAAHTPPASWYTEPFFYELERRAVLRPGWHAVARTDQLEKPGSYATARVAGEPLLVLRDSGQRLRGFYNVCRHHAAELLPECGETDHIVCPYHGWTYGLDGALTRAPGLGGVATLERQSIDLLAVSAEVLGPLVFASPAADAPALAPAIPELLRRLDASGWQDLRFVARRRYELRCNWKVVVDNYLDGGYHVARLHPELADRLQLASYRTEVLEHCAIQSSGGDDSERPSRVGGDVLYGWLWPCTMINRYGPFLDTNAVHPLAHDRTAIVYDYWCREDLAGDGDFVQRSLRASDAVQREDTRICESVQRGLASGGFDRGPYAPAFERAAHHFHCRLAESLAGGLC